MLITVNVLFVVNALRLEVNYFGVVAVMFLHTILCALFAKASANISHLTRDLCFRKKDYC